MKLTVVILNYNVSHFLELCLKSVQDALVSIDAEIIVVDNKSPDDSCEMVKQLFPDVILIENEDNFGFSKGNNVGVEQAHGEYICILNPDTVVAEDTFLKILSVAELKNNLGIIGCKLIDGKGEFLPESKRNIPTPFVAIRKILGFSRMYYVSNLGQNDTGRVPIFVGAFMFMKKTVYKEVKGFDEDYFMYGEDVDLSYKVLKSNYHNMYHGSTSVMHYKGESTLKDKIYAKRFYDAMQIFYNKHFKSNAVFNLLVWLGIKLSFIFNNNDQIKTNKPKNYVLISDKNYPSLETKLEHEVKLQSKIENYALETEYILDNNVLSFKTIIDIISKSPKKSSVTFKILPKNTNFIIGSNSSKSRGVVMTF
ncbi:glycosyl transferase family 2 [Flavobacteriales bacterium 34_180_T64]|nr:glycosyl transferase family 2 [Flavobacteriales bacterium 34_180_T64]